MGTRGFFRFSYFNFILLVIFLCFRTSLHARLDLVPGSRYTTVRAATLGDAFLPLAEDGATGLFYNPAGLAKTRVSHFDPFDVTIYGNDQYLNLFGIKSISTFYKVTSLQSFLPLLQQNAPKYISVGSGLSTAFSTRIVTFGILGQTQLGSQVNQDGTIHYRSLYQIIPALGSGIRLASGIVRIGYSLQWVNQASGTFNGVSASSSPLGYNQNISQGAAISHNFGFALSLPFQFLPSFNLVARNARGAKFSSFSLIPLARNSSDPPPDEAMSVDAALGIKPKIGLGAYSNILLQLRDVSNTSKVPLQGRISFGLEISFRDSFFLRGGWGGGYPNGGFGLRRKGSDFSLGWISEDVGSTYHGQRDIRYILQYQARAF